jgi:hypothetical protein
VKEGFELGLGLGLGLRVGGFEEFVAFDQAGVVLLLGEGVRGA